MRIATVDTIDAVPADGEYGSWNLFVLINQLLGIHKLIPEEVVTRYTQAKIAKGLKYNEGMGRSNLLKMVLSPIYRKHEKSIIPEIKRAACEDAAVDKLTKGAVDGNGGRCDARTGHRFRARMAHSLGSPRHRGPHHSRTRAHGYDQTNEGCIGCAIWPFTSRDRQCEGRRLCSGVGTQPVHRRCGERGRHLQRRILGCVYRS